MGLGPSLPPARKRRILPHKLGGIRRFRENGMSIFYCAGCKFLWLAHLSKGEENGGDASVGQVTERWIQKHRTLPAYVWSC